MTTDKFGDAKEVFGLPQPKEVFLETGEQVYDFAESDFGNQPPVSKEDMLGKPIIVRGLSTETFDGGYGALGRSMRWNSLDEDAPDDEPWGFFFSDDSTIIQQVRKAENAGRTPFIAIMVKVDSQAHKGQSYYKLARYVRPVAPSENPEPAKKR